MSVPASLRALVRRPSAWARIQRRRPASSWSAPSPASRSATRRPASAASSAGGHGGSASARRCQLGRAVVGVDEPVDVAAEPQPQLDVALDDVGHLPEWTLNRASRGRSRASRASTRPRLGVVDLGPRVVEERVVGVGHHVDPRIEPGRLHVLLHLLGQVGTEVVVVSRRSGRGPQRRASTSRAGARPHDQPVPGHRRLDLVGTVGREHQRQPAAHAESGDADPVAARHLRHLVDRAGHVLGGLLDVQRHHELAGLVGLGGRLAVVQVGREGHEPLGGEAVADVFDVGHQAPPLLDDDDRDAPAALGHGQVALGGAAVARELDDLSHAG